MGRPGWNEFFLRQNRSVYLVDQVSRARSGFDPTQIYEVQAGARTTAQMPGIVDGTHQFAWSVFRFGPEYGKAFADEQFPIDAVNELYKQMIPDLNSTLVQDPNPTWTQLAALATKLRGAVLVGHSESGFFPERTALLDSTGVRGIVTIEMQCDTALTAAQLAKLARVPTLIMFGDHLADVKAPFSWSAALDSCKTVHRAAEITGWRWATDVSAGTRHQGQQPHADAGPKQPISSPDWSKAGSNSTSR